MVKIKPEILHHFLYEVEELIRHIAEGHVHEGWGRDYRTAVRESHETLLAMISTHTRITHTTKWHIVIDNVHNHIVDTCATRNGMAENIVALFAEIIECQGAFTLSHKLRNLFYLLESQYRENRTKDLLLHDRGVRTDVRQNGWTQIAVSAVVVTAVIDSRSLRCRW